MAQLYYSPPKEILFEEVRQKAIEIWKSYDDSYGYATSKINTIKDITNSEGNFMFMVSMFDINNQKKLSDSLSIGAREAIRIRLIDGGALSELIVF